MYIIDQKEGLSAEFSKLVAMMEYTRKTTLDEVQNLSIEELDYLYADDANSIGMLLAHMASVEKFYQIDTFEKREITEEDVALLNPGLQLGERAREEINGQSIKVYVNELAEVRKKTIETFKSLPDSWLFEQKPFFGGHPTNIYFKWFHVFEDELSHRGQIRLIKKMMKK
ncbi:DinB family protein [Sporosarcina sp. ITBMC105]